MTGRVAARSALLDGLEALADHRAALVLIGAQAIYLHTGGALVALAEATKDSDLAMDPRVLSDDPRLEDAMRRAGFQHNPLDPQPGSWVSPRGIPVDLMVPARLSGEGGRRGGRIPPHSAHATRRATGLEAAVVDHAPMVIEGLDPDGPRRVEIKVAGPAALLVAKLHKLGERQNTPGRLLDKDAHDLYRLREVQRPVREAPGLGNVGARREEGLDLCEGLTGTRRITSRPRRISSSIWKRRSRWERPP